ncbi:hypothetical protein PCE1_000493 [Barthelona sp. PCE]
MAPAAQQNKAPIVAKVVLLGVSAAGKSCLVLRFVKDQFVEKLGSTIGAAFLFQHVPLSNGHIVKLEIWDTAGQDRYQAFTPMYYRDAQIALLVYSVESHESFENTKKRLADLRAHGVGIIALVAAKNDLEDVVGDEAREWAESENLLYFRTSAKSGSGVTDLFHSVAEQVKTDMENDTDDEDMFEIVQVSNGSTDDGTCNC